VFNLFQITQEIALAHTKHAIRNGVKITLKPFFTSDTVYSKRRNVQQIITNLISNAVKYTETGVIEIAVVDLGTDFLAVDVKDSGVGIDQENQKRLFEAFSQAQNHEDLNSRGYGLGLHIVKKMSQELGGDVVLVESAVNIGSTFRFKLPRVAHRKTSETF
jgi:signal transduction histidine kinase